MLKKLVNILSFKNTDWKMEKLSTGILSMEE